MGILRKASLETVRLFLDESKEDFVEVLTDMSKRQFNAIVASMPGKIGDDVTAMTVGEATEFQKNLFASLVTGWSLEEPPTVENYEALSAESANAIDAALAEHFGSLNPGREQSKEPSTSVDSTPKGTGSTESSPRTDA